MDQVIATAPAKQPADRYASTTDLAAAAHRAISSPAGSSQR
jgi:hypothetical protein